MPFGCERRPLYAFILLMWLPLSCNKNRARGCVIGLHEMLCRARPAEWERGKRWKTASLLSKSKEDIELQSERGEKERVNGIWYSTKRWLAVCLSVFRQSCFLFFFSPSPLGSHAPRWKTAISHVWYQYSAYHLVNPHPNILLIYCTVSPVYKCSKTNDKYAFFVD